MTAAAIRYFCFLITAAASAFAALRGKSSETSFPSLAGTVQNKQLEGHSNHTKKQLEDMLRYESESFERLHSRQITGADPRAYSIRST